MNQSPFAALSVPVTLLFIAIAAGCGGRGGYQADRTVPALEDRVRDVQRGQDESAKQGSRIEMRVYELQVKVGQLMEQLRQVDARCGRGQQTTPAPVLLPPSP